MNKLMIPAILAVTVMVAGIFAFAPVEQASTVHTTITLGTSTGETTVNTNIESTQTQIATLVQTGTSTEAIGGGANAAGVTATSDGIAYITVETTTDGTGATGVVINIAGTDVCTDVTITVAESPYTCAAAVNAAELIIITTVNGADDAASIATVTILSASANP